MKRTISLLLALAFCLPLSALRAEAASGYALPERLDGCENIFLSYTFNCSNWSSGRRTKAGYKPLVGYYDTEGTLRDTFFDTFLFLPCVTSTPSGGKTYRDNENPANLSDWRMFIDDVFLDGYNIDALNEAVGEMKATLGASYTDYKARVFLSCMYPVKTQTQFGDLNGDAKITATDYLLAKKSILKLAELDEVQTEAFKLGGTTAPSASNYLKLKKHVLKLADLFA